MNQINFKTQETIFVPKKLIVLFLPDYLLILLCSYILSTGKAKGQGQDKDVLLNRRHKEANKNSNRKKGADWKRREF